MMSLARSRAIAPCRATIALRRASHRTGRGTSRSASDQGLVGVGGEALRRCDRVSFLGGMAEAVDGGVHGRGIHDPCGCGQFVLVVASVSVIGEKRVDRRLQVGVGGTFRDPVEPLVECGPQAFVVGHDAAQ